MSDLVQSEGQRPLDPPATIIKTNPDTIESQIKTAIPTYPEAELPSPAIHPEISAAIHPDGGPRDEVIHSGAVAMAKMSEVLGDIRNQTGIDAIHGAVEKKNLNEAYATLDNGHKEPEGVDTVLVQRVGETAKKNMDLRVEGKSLLRKAAGAMAVDRLLDGNAVASFKADIEDEIETGIIDAEQNEQNSESSVSPVVVDSPIQTSEVVDAELRAIENNHEEVVMTPSTTSDERNTPSDTPAADAVEARSTDPSGNDATVVQEELSTEAQDLTLDEGIPGDNPEEPKEESNTQEGASLQDQVSGQLGLGPSSPSHDSDPAETQSEQDQAKVELPNVVTPVAEVNPAQPPVGPVLPDVQTQPATTEANMPAGDSVIVPQPIPEKKGLFGVDWKELVFGSKAKNNE